MIECKQIERDLTMKKLGSRRRVLWR